MCDIVGDICGIISGSLGTIIVIKMANNWQVPESWIDLLILSLIASLTVGGKSFLKNYGIKRANEIILFVGKILASPVFLKNAISKH
jgi:CBS domain containing-hemolysin-like protein